MKATYTIEEKVQIIKWYYTGNSIAKTSQLFSKVFENRPIPSQSTISRIITRFDERGCVSDCKKCLRSDVIDDAGIRQKNNGGRRPGRPWNTKTEADRCIEKMQNIQKSETLAIHNEIVYNSLNITEKPETNRDTESVNKEDSEESSALCTQNQQDEGVCETEEVKIENMDIVEEFKFPESDARMLKRELEYFDVPSEILQTNNEKVDNMYDNSSKQIINTDMKHSRSDLCENGLVSESELKEHVDNVSSKLNCDFCNYSVTRKTDLIQHIDSFHSKLKQQKCKFCDYTTKHKGNLKMHIDSVHLNLKKHKCHLCGYATSRKDVLKVHIDSVHLNSKKYKCHLCDFSANHKCNLKTHVDTNHLNLKQHKCHICEYAANKDHDLKIHISAVHLNLKRFKCQHCDYVSSWRSGLKIHIESVHLNLKKYKCSLCDFTSYMKSNFKIHVDSVHSVLKQHKCDLCKYETNRRYELKKHIDSIHLNFKQLT